MFGAGVVTVARTGLAWSSGHRGLKRTALYTRLHFVFTPPIPPFLHQFRLPSNPLAELQPARGTLHHYLFSSISSAMAQIRGTAGYNLGHQNPFGGPGSADATNDPSPLDAIREQTSKIEDWLDSLADPVKPYVSSSIYLWSYLAISSLLDSFLDGRKPVVPQTRDLQTCTNTVFSCSADTSLRSVAS